MASTRRGGSRRSSAVSVNGYPALQTSARAFGRTHSVSPSRSPTPEPLTKLEQRARRKMQAEMDAKRTAEEKALKQGEEGDGAGEDNEAAVETEPMATEE